MALPRIHKQGSLDGLCGLYSITNAFTRLVEGLDPDEVFRQAASGMHRRVYPDVLWDGLDIDDLLRSTRSVARWVEKKHNVRIIISLPFKDRRFQKTADFLDELASLIGNQKGNAILSVDWGKTKGGGGHWLVYQRHENSKVRVFDSDGPCSMKTRTLSVKGQRGDQIKEGETVLIRRIEKN